LSHNTLKNVGGKKNVLSTKRYSISRHQDETFHQVSFSPSFLAKGNQGILSGYLSISVSHRHDFSADLLLIEKLWSGIIVLLSKTVCEVDHVHTAGGLG